MTTGAKYSPRKWKKAARLIGLPIPQARKLVLAADLETRKRGYDEERAGRLSKTLVHKTA